MLLMAKNIEMIFTDSLKWVLFDTEQRWEYLVHVL